MENKKDEKKITYFILLHIALIIYALGSFFSKSASFESFLSFKYCCFYAGLLGTLFLYALIWQQAIKHIDLTTAFANKGITIVWGLLIGKLIFGEDISLKKILGTIIIIVGIIIVVNDNGK